MSLTDLPKEIVIKITLLACSDRDSVNITLQTLARTCQYVYDVIRENIRIFLNKYIQKHESYNQQRGAEIIYRFGSWIHNIDDKPAIINIDGSKYWYRCGQSHRGDDNPAVVRINGRACPSRNTRCKRTGNYDKQRTQECKIHENNITLEWWYRGRRHRANNQPAIDWGNGAVEFWVNGKRMSVKKE